MSRTRANEDMLREVADLRDAPFSTGFVPDLHRRVGAGYRSFWQMNLSKLKRYLEES